MANGYYAPFYRGGYFNTNPPAPQSFQPAPQQMPEVQYQAPYQQTAPVQSQIYDGNRDRFGGLDVNLLRSEAMKLRQSLQQHPRQIVEQMVRSGQIPQAELNRVFPIATELSQLFR